jgi:hypothetical protein
VEAKSVPSLEHEQEEGIAGDVHVPEVAVCRDFSRLFELPSLRLE